jgi:hypothetical protein
MGAVSSLRTAGGALARNPVILAGTFLGAAFGVGQFAAQGLEIPFLGPLLGLVSFLVSPFLAAGVFGMADEAVDGNTSFGTFLRVGRARYLPYLLASLLYAVLAGVVAFALVLVVAIVVLVGIGVGMGAAGNPEAIGALGTATVVGIALVVLVAVLLFVLFVFFLQFFGVAIVVDRAGVAGCFGRSYRLVRRNLLGTLGYSVLRILVNVLALVPFVVIAAVLFVAGGGGEVIESLDASVNGTNATTGAPFDATGPALSPVALTGIAIAFLVYQTLVSGYLQTYAVAFYRDRRTPGSE